MNPSMGKFALVALGLLGLIGLLPLSSNSLDAIVSRDSFLAQVFTGDFSDRMVCQRFCEENAGAKMGQCQPPAEEEGTPPDPTCLDGVNTFFASCSQNCQQGFDAATAAAAAAQAVALEAQQQAKMEQAEQKLEEQLELRTALFCTQRCEQKANDRYAELKSVGTDERLAKNDAQTTFDTCNSACLISQQAAPVIDNQTAPIGDPGSGPARMACIADCDARLAIWKQECGVSRSCVDEVQDIYRDQCLPGCYGATRDVQLPPMIKAPGFLIGAGSDVAQKLLPLRPTGSLPVPAVPAQQTTQSQPAPSPSTSFSNQSAPPPNQAPAKNAVVSIVSGIVDAVVDFFKGIFGSNDTKETQPSTSAPADRCAQVASRSQTLSGSANIKHEGGSVPATLTAGLNPILSKAITDANTACVAAARQALQQAAANLAVQFCGAGCSSSYKLVNEIITGCNVSETATVSNGLPGANSQGVGKGSKGSGNFYVVRSIGKAEATFTPSCRLSPSQGSGVGSAAVTPEQKLPANAQFEILVDTKDGLDSKPYTDATAKKDGTAIWFINEGEKVYATQPSPVEKAINDAITNGTIKGLRASAVSVRHRHADDTRCFKFDKGSCLEKLWGQLPRVTINLTSSGKLLASTGYLYPHLSGGMGSIIAAIQNILDENGIPQD